MRARVAIIITKAHLSTNPMRRTANIQHACTAKVQTANPPVGNEKQIDLEACSERVLKRKRQRVDDT